MQKSLMKLVDNLYTGEQKVASAQIIKEEQSKDLANRDNHLLNYKILAVALGDKLITLNEDEIKDFYGKENFVWLTPVDFVIANILTTCEKLTKQPTRETYENEIVLSKEQPEFEYLVGIVEQIMKGEI